MDFTNLLHFLFVCSVFLYVLFLNLCFSSFLHREKPTGWLHPVIVKIIQSVDQAANTLIGMNHCVWIETHSLKHGKIILEWICLSQSSCLARLHDASVAKIIIDHHNHTFAAKFGIFGFALHTNFEDTLTFVVHICSSERNFVTNGLDGFTIIWSKFNLSNTLAYDQTPVKLIHQAGVYLCGFSTCRQCPSYEIDCTAAMCW